MSKYNRTVEVMGTLNRATEILHLDDEQGNVAPQTIALHEFIGTTAIYIEHGCIQVNEEYVPELIKMLQRSLRRKVANEQRKVEQEKYNKREAKRLAKRAGQPS